MWNSHFECWNLKTTDQFSGTFPCFHVTCVVSVSVQHCVMYLVSVLLCAVYGQNTLVLVWQQYSQWFDDSTHNTLVLVRPRWHDPRHPVAPICPLVLRMVGMIIGAAENAQDTRMLRKLSKGRPPQNGEMGTLDSSFFYRNTGAPRISHKFERIQKDCWFWQSYIC